jgi:outer membrane protein OmpA-like peptidoglycan-associated protein
MRLFIFSLLFVNFLNAQNLVINPSFEESETGESGLMSIANVTGWSVPSKGTSDYIRPTSKERKEQAKETPAYAHTIPYEGKACAGFHGHVGGYEYVCGTLTTALTKDSVYTISFVLSTAFDHAFDPARIGVYFTRESNPYYRPENDARRIEVIPQVSLASAEVITQSGYWTVYSVNYTAAGGEKRFIIGDFTDKFQPGMQGKEADYFFIDSMYIGAAKNVQHENAPDLVVTEEQPAPPTVVNDTVIAPGRTLTLENIYFETNKSRILPESYPPLYNIIIEMKLQPDLKVEIIGHTDKHGAAADNQKLSEQRAAAVRDFFISNGIDPSRITTAGRGSSQPVGDNDQKNRRVEFRFYE